MTLEEYTEAVRNKVSELYESDYDITGYEEMVSDAFAAGDSVEDCAKEVYDTDCSYGD